MRGSWLTMLVLAGLTITACGHDDKGSSSVDHAKQRYIAKADAICRAVKPMIERYRGQYQALRVTAPGKDVARVFIREFLAERKELEGLKALPAPSEDKANLDAYFAAVDKGVEVDMVVVAATERTDTGEILRSVYKSHKLGDQQLLLAKRYGFRACGPISEVAQ